VTLYAPDRPGAQTKAATTLASWSNILPAKTIMSNGASGWRAAVSDRAVMIPRGAGRNFNDCAVVSDGVTCTLRGRDRVLALDESAPSITVEAGLGVGELHRLLERTGLEFPIFGGTQWATVGGATAANIHGKNHPAAGSFGNHVLELTLLTAEGDRAVCGPESHPDLFRATIGGMGLTGLIESVVLRLRPTGGRTLQQSRAVITDTGSMFDLFEKTDTEFGQGVWPTLTERGTPGLFLSATRESSPSRPPRPAIRVPLPRLRAVRPGLARIATAVTIRAALQPGTSRIHIRKYNYSGSHEVIFHWNRLFGGQGMIAFQWTMPELAFKAALCDLVGRARQSDIPLLSAVVKRFGAHPPAGMLAFPLEGYTLCCQTPYTRRAIGFLRDFADEVVGAGGRVNLTKDSCVSPNQLAQMYPRLPEWQRTVERYDPQRRVVSNLSSRLELKPW
jgi:decaprenylphospho-beta-D-ribofuranose 2-oxidase